MVTLLLRVHRDERGGVLIMVAGFVPVAIILASFVIDVGNAFEHRRHLQVQADAGVLAAAQEFLGCFTDADGANGAIEAQALAYSGGEHNPQVGSPDAQSRVVPRINATSYSADSYTDGEPCQTGFIDLKLTEEDSPPFFGIFGSHDYKADARIQVFKIRSSNKLLPIAVPDPDPKLARALFVDESTGSVLASTDLERTGASGGLAIWDNEETPVAVPITAEHVGVRIVLGGASSTTCGAVLVSCYDSESGNGIVHIRGWSGAGTAQPKSPLLRSVTLRNGTCTDPYFSASDVACTIGVDAVVDFGADPVVLGATLEANVGGTPVALTYDPATATWSSATAAIAAQSGPRDVSLSWRIDRNPDGSSCRPANTCRGDFGVVQRHFAATPDRSGPIALAQVTEGGAAANSLQRCSAALGSCTHSLVVKIGIKGGLALSDLDDPPVRLRVIGGSQNQSLDCDPDVSKLKDELANGCAPAYTPNTGSACPTSPSALWAIPNPPKAWDCVATQTGNATNQVAEGLNTRILGTPSPDTCPPERRNKWPDIQQGDPRVVFVLVTPFGSFSGSGNTTVPVMRFAAFYITGWTGQGGGFANPCLDQGDELPTNPAEIVGRFIKYVDNNEGGAGDETCDLTDPSALDPCTAVLVR